MNLGFRNDALLKNGNKWENENGLAIRFCTLLGRITGSQVALHRA